MRSHSQLSMESIAISAAESKVDRMSRALYLASKAAQEHLREYGTSNEGEFSSRLIDTCDEKCYENSSDGGKSMNTFYHHQRSPPWKDVRVQKREKSASYGCISSTMTPFGCPDQFGVPVNGFHPQWSASPNLCLPAPLLNSTRAPSSCSAHQKTLNEKILEMIGDFKREEKERSRKRGKLGAAPMIPYTIGSSNSREKRKRPASDATFRVSQGHEVQLQSSPAPKESDKDKKRLKVDSPRSSATSLFSDIYGDVFLNSDVPQLIATSGGRVIAWNNIFRQITGLSSEQISSSMSVFSLIVPRMMPKLFELFGIALRGGSPHPSVFRNAEDKENDGAFNSDSSASDSNIADQGISGGTDEDTGEGDGDSEFYTSMTLPCVRLAMADTPFQITLALMDDLDPNKCCFYCILSHADANDKTKKKTNKCSKEQAKTDQSLHPRNEARCENDKNAAVLGKIQYITGKEFADLLSPP